MSTKLIVRTYRFIFPLKIWFCSKKKQNKKSIILHSRSCSAEWAVSRNGSSSFMNESFQFECVSVSLHSSPGWYSLQTWWSSVWWWSRWGAQRSGSGRRWSWRTWSSVPLLCRPSLETETQNEKNELVSL